MYRWIVVVVRSDFSVSVASFPERQKAECVAAGIRFALKGLPATAKVVDGLADDE